MMGHHGLTKENLVRSLPVSLSSDPKMLALAESISELLAQRREEIARLAIYPHVDRLDEALLDILAQDFKVDWWDNNYSLEEKRRTLSASWQVHKTLGTKAAVEKALRAIYPSTTVKEWFDYGGKPYHFRLDINVTDDEADSAKQRGVLKRLQYYKNLRSHLDGVTYFLQSQAQAPAGACFLWVHGRVGAAGEPAQWLAPGGNRPESWRRVPGPAPAAGRKHHRHRAPLAPGPRRDRRGRGAAGKLSENRYTSESE